MREDTLWLIEFNRKKRWEWLKIQYSPPSSSHFSVTHSSLGDEVDGAPGRLIVLYNLSLIIFEFKMPESYGYTVRW